MSLASVQSRISSIQDMINSLNNHGRPPVSVTEDTTSTSKSGTSASTTGADSTNFATKLSDQVAAASKTTPTRTSGKGELQGAPGTAEAFVKKVRSYIGVPYVWGGTDPKTGLDCSGLVQTAAREVGVTLPRVTYDQQHAGVEVDGIDNAKPGDLLILRNSGHVAVYVGNGKAIHAPRPGQNVTEADVSELGSIVTIRRVMRSATDNADTSGATANRVSTQNSAAKASPSVTRATADSDQSVTREVTGDNSTPQNHGSAVAPSADAVVAGLVSLLGALGNAALAQNNATVGAANRPTTNAGNSTDLAAALVGALSGTGAGSAGTNPLASLIGTANSNNSYSSTLLSQFLGGSSLYGSNAAGGLGALAGKQGTAGANASLTNTASSLSALGALRSSLGV